MARGKRIQYTINKEAPCVKCSSETRNETRERTGHDCHTSCELYLSWKHELELANDNRVNYYNLRNARNYIGYVPRGGRRNWEVRKK